MDYLILACIVINTIFLLIIGGNMNNNLLKVVKAIRESHDELNSGINAIMKSTYKVSSLHLLDPKYEFRKTLIKSFLESEKKIKLPICLTCSHLSTYYNVDDNVAKHIRSVKTNEIFSGPCFALVPIKTKEANIFRLDITSEISIDDAIYFSSDEAKGNKREYHILDFDNLIVTDNINSENAQKYRVKLVEEKAFNIGNINTIYKNGMESQDGVKINRMLKSIESMMETHYERFGYEFDFLNDEVLSYNAKQVLQFAMNNEFNSEKMDENETYIRFRKTCSYLEFIALIDEIGMRLGFLLYKIEPPKNES